MKNIKIRKKIENNKAECVLCQANFEVWLNNLKLSEERREKISQHLLSYCPVCTRKGECN